MKKTFTILSALAIIILTGCSGSDTYRGNWKATNEAGDKFDITFEGKHFTIKSMDGKKDEHEYRQNSVNIKNSVETYGILTKDGLNWQIQFPLPKDESLGLIEDANGRPIFIISRNEYVHDINRLRQ